jgi:predicted secreted acid phosphatase
MIDHIFKCAVVAAFVLASAMFTATGVQAETIKIATWNLEHLAERDGAGCRPRVEKDYETLRHYARKLKADVIALQEIESIAAAHRVFDPTVYRIEISRRPYTGSEECRDLAGNFLTAQRVGFAIKKHIPYTRLPDFQELGVSGTRWGVEILVYPRTTPVSLLSIHLKSRCFSDPLDAASSNPNCVILAQQRSLLEGWIDRHAARGERFIILGDFNRQLNVAGDEFWREIDDSEPNLAADLERATAGHLDTGCHPRYPQLIDHIVLDRGTDLMARENTLRIMRYAEPWEQRPSDHCPVSVDIVLDDGLHPGLQWVRRSAEYRALALDIYEQARKRVKQIALERQVKEDTVPWVVSIDADATILDNTPLNVAGELTFRAITYGRWDAWVRRAAAEPVPGVLSFFDTVRDLGGKIAIITNRSHRHHAGDTLNNLRRWGTNVDPKTVCILGRMPQDLQERNPNEWRDFGYKNDKDRRRRLLTEGKADLCWVASDDPGIRQSWQRPHDIVMYLGDNIQDFPEFEQQEIARHPHRAADRIGVDFFLFPNPIYGSWK